MTIKEMRNPLCEDEANNLMVGMRILSYKKELQIDIFVLIVKLRTNKIYVHSSMVLFNLK